MGLVYADIELLNPRQPERRPLPQRALVDTGSTYLVIPEHAAIQLGLEELETREITLADGAKVAKPYVGPVEIRAFGRRAFVGAIVAGDETLFGAIPMEDMDLMVHPKTLAVGPNPLSPNIPTGKAKTLRATEGDDYA
ncbi:MAG TPA: clan AA aspartic protease [Allosphingosinicella sp.]|nr:clan AA aspartic protease [Allosphingosinicella sp.]